MSPKLFTASDVERAARLAAQYAANDVSTKLTGATRGNAWQGIEAAVQHGVATITDDTSPFYSEEEVVLMLQYLLEKEDVRAEFEDAVATALRR